MGRRASPVSQFAKRVTILVTTITNDFLGLFMQNQI
jgi:hypothetical protein